MRIVAFGDLHGSVEELDGIYAQSETADLTVVAGDITSFGRPADAERIMGQIQRHSNQLLAVAGNCDSAAINEKLDGLGVGIHAKGRTIHGIGFLGLSGSSRTPFDTPFELSESEIEQALQLGLEQIRDVPRKVLISHAPPYGTQLDRVRGGHHAGSKAVRAFVEQQEPDLVLCGHIHESPGIDQLGRTRMVNLGMARKGCYAVIDMDEEIVVSLFGVSSLEP